MYNTLDDQLGGYDYIEKGVIKVVKVLSQEKCVTNKATPSSIKSIFWVYNKHISMRRTP